MLCCGVLARSLASMPSFLMGECRLPRERTETIEGDFDMKLILLPWLDLSFGPGYRTDHIARRGSTKSKLACRKESAVLYLIVSGKTPLHCFLSFD